MAYEVAYVSIGSNSMTDALSRLGAAVKSTPLLSNLIGCWYTEIGTFGRIVTIRTKQPSDEATRTNDLARGASDFSCIADLAVDVRIDTFVSFPFMPDIPTGQFGPLYEMRRLLVEGRHFRAIALEVEGGIGILRSSCR